jgi:hypothetical protein
MRMTFRIVLLLAALCLTAVAAWGTATTTQITIDPYTGSIYVESGETVVPLYEGTFQLETRYIIGGLLSNAINYVGQLITKEEIPDLDDTILQFWQNACCYANAWTCPSYRESLKFGVSVKDTRKIWDSAKKYTLFHLSHRTLWEIGYTDAMRIPYYGARRAFVTQIGQLKVLTVIRGIGLLQMTPGCPASADFAIDVWVSIYPANVDLILQARRYPLWP